MNRDTCPACGANDGVIIAEQKMMKLAFGAEIPYTIHYRHCLTCDKTYETDPMRTWAATGLAKVKLIEQ